DGALEKPGPICAKRRAIRTVRAIRCAAEIAASASAFSSRPVSRRRLARYLADITKQIGYDLILWGGSRPHVTRRVADPCSPWRGPIETSMMRSSTVLLIVAL